MLSETSLQIIGYSALLLSCLSFGTMFVPLRKKKCGDGMFVQWIECSVVFIIGAIIYAARDFPKFEPVACIGGLLYATGNVFSVPIIEGIGMGIGFLIWSSLQIIVGWGVARFGLFGWIAPQNVKNDVLNYIGIVLTIVSGVLLLFVERVEEKDDSGEDLEDEEEKHRKSSDFSSNPTFKSYLQKIPYIFMACILACLHGLMMSPIDYLKQHNSSTSTTDPFQIFDYIFPFYTSVFLFSTIYFLGYCLIRRESSHVEKSLIVPSILYGLLWTGGMTLWFVSSDKLSQVVAYPCTARLPPLISGALDVFVFRSIQGQKSYLILGISSIIGVVAVILIGLSNQI